MEGLPNFSFLVFFFLVFFFFSLFPAAAALVLFLSLSLSLAAPLSRKQQQAHAEKLDNEKKTISPSLLSRETARPRRTSRSPTPSA